MAIKTENMIFVFGSNLAGIHGAGAALFAFEERGAKMGMSVGRTGQCYAIPTKGASRAGGVGRTLPLEHVKIFVDEFIEHARERPSQFYQVTRIGCGLAGLRDEDIAPMFADAPENCWFDSAWQSIFDQQYFGKKFNYWGTF